MQWLMNEFKAFKEDVAKRIDSGIAKYVEEQTKAAAEIEKLKGEIKAMKARAGKTKD